MADPKLAATFTLPPSLDELDLARERERLELRDRQEHEEAFTKAKAAWQQMPPAFHARAEELVARCRSLLLRQKVNGLGKPTLSALLIGPSGDGKSSAAACLVRRALAAYTDSKGTTFKAAIGFQWVTAADLAMADRRHPLGDGRPPVIEKAMRASALVLDDVGLEVSAEPILDVLRVRYDMCLPTICTSGLTQDELERHLGSAGVRRMVDQHAGFPLLMVDSHAKKTTAKKT
jgi:DNA replication protein DnaC